MTCAHPGCERKHRARGFCRKHYERLINTGTTEPTSRRNRFADGSPKTLPGPPGSYSGCWEWQGARNEDDYGRLRWDGAMQYVHRVVLAEWLGRPLADDELALHSCDNPPCYRPDHLSPGSHEENMADMVAKGRSFKRSYHGGELKRTVFADDPGDF